MSRSLPMLILRSALFNIAFFGFMTLTMIGYATRKLGNYDRGLAYYAKALALDSNNINTHEYLGEAYAEKGKVDLAKTELIKVAAVCGTTCEQYQDLSKAIAGTPDED